MPSNVSLATVEGTNLMHQVCSHEKSAMLQRTKEAPELWDLTYVHTLVIESTHKYKVPIQGPHQQESRTWRMVSYAIHRL